MTPLTESPLWSDTEADFDLETWSPLDLASAERLMRAYARLEKRIQGIRQNAQAMREDIDRWESDTCGPKLERLVHLDRQLQEMARQYRALDEKHNKTLRLPSGAVESRTHRPGLEITDEPALVAFLRNVAAELGQPVENYLAVKITPKKGAVKELLAPAGLEHGVAVLFDGEPVPGVEVKGGGIGFTVKVGGGE